MNILAIGNSFSRNATRYLHGIARADGVELLVANLYIGGCPLERHYRNLKGDRSVYELDYNGEKTLFQVSIKEALLNRSWDIVTVQQAALQAYKKESFFPYINVLVDYIKELCPNAKIIIHESWACETGCAYLVNTPFANHQEMHEAVSKTYAEVAGEIGADGIIPSGKIIAHMVKNGITIHRDGHHVTYGLGQYTLALLWYRMLTGKTVKDNTFCDFDEPVDPAHIPLAKEFADSCTPLF